MTTEIIAVLTTAAENLALKNYSIDPNMDAHNGDGLIAELYKSLITDNETSTKIHLVVKKAPVDETRRNRLCVHLAFVSEIHFYTKIVPAFKKLQEEKRVRKVFDSLPKCLASVTDIGQEIVVLNDITKLGFRMFERAEEFDEEHYRFIFATYGRFHALSFCLKDQKPEEYNDLIRPMRNVWLEFGKKVPFCNALQSIVQRSYDALDPVEDVKVREMFGKYVENILEIYKINLSYSGNYSGILHGDCWSNNLMFKYEGSKIKEMSLLDFQMTWVGSPVHDLSYALYCGASTEVLYKLEDLLDVYHKSFSASARELGSDPSKLLPRYVLSEEWKIYSKYGMIMAFLGVHLKLMTKQSAAETSELFKKPFEGTSSLMTTQIDKNVFNKRVRDIIIHMYDTNAL